VNAKPNKSAASFQMPMVPGTSIHEYLSAVNGLPLLSPAEERELGRRIFHHQDVDAARQMVMAYLRFVGHIARAAMRAMGSPFRI
jgi:DNA-directed RNA polymerase sigma subunit (sigma70/sigma32)